MATPDALSPRSDSRAQPPDRSRRRWARIGLRALGVILAGALLIMGAGVLWLRSVAHRALPILDGDLHLAGLSAPVTVRRDAHGVPHIQAASQNDLFLAQGYVTAQDRLWQMDMMRRNGNGELAEILGPSLAPRDRAQRVFRFRAMAQRIYAAASPSQRAPFEAYARGVNLFITTHKNELPPEFRVLMYQPRPWTGIDSMSINMMMIELLDTQWDAKLGRESLASRLNNPQVLNDLYPVGSWRDHPPTGEKLDLSQPHPTAQPGSSDDEDDDRTQAYVKVPAPTGGASQTTDESFGTLSDLSELRHVLGSASCESCIPGSNNWVIAGSHTASGKPLLSNDMHLPLTEPNIWYMADLQAPGLHVAGVTLPGIPFVIAGYNEHVAWGFTTMMGDVQDIYVESLDGKGNYQAADGGWKPLTIDHEIIHVRGSKDIVLDVQSTAHGPLLNPILPHESRALALRWTLYDPSLTWSPIESINIAGSCTEMTVALGQWNWPTQNVVYADDQGHIAYHAVGKIPIRPAGLAGLPISDWRRDPHREWNGYIPFAAMPNAYDPPSGFLATANSRVSADNSPYPLSLEWADPYRVERIYKSLQGRDRLTAKDMLAVQTDIYSEVDQEIGHRLAYAIDHSGVSDERLHKAADLMRSWDGRLTVDSAAASLVDQTRAALWTLILQPKVGDAMHDYHWGESAFAEEEIIMHGSSNWLPSGYSNWDALLTDAVRRGMEQGKAPQDIGSWAYGKWHVVDIEHPLADLLPLISRIAGTGPQPLSGDATTVKQVGRSFGPSQRFTMDWSNVDASTENIALGESGNPYSPYFRDQWDDYYRGTTFSLPFTDSAVAAQTKHQLHLLP